MKVSLPFGTDELTVHVPDGTTIVEPRSVTPLDDPWSTVAASLARPHDGPSLTELVARLSVGDRVVIVIPDHTRPMPHKDVLPPLLDALTHAGVGANRVSLLVATGTHSPPPVGEMERRVGSSVANRVPILVHRATIDPHTEVGKVDGVPVLLDSRYVDAALKITSGFVEPHFFAGFSGGPKGVCPGLAATSTTLEAHSTARIASSLSTWLRTDGNPVHDFVRAAVALCPPDLSIDVTTESAGKVTGVYTGPLHGGHRVACQQVEETSVVQVPHQYPVVIVTNGGDPLDRNLYQAVKGMAAAERVVTDGGVIIVAAACGDGVPADEAFARILGESTSAEELLGGPTAFGLPSGPPTEQDRWQAQVLGRVLRRAEVRLFSRGVSSIEARAAHLNPVDDLQASIDQAIDHASRAATTPDGHTGDPSTMACVLLHGPLVVATAPPS